MGELAYRVARRLWGLFLPRAWRSSWRLRLLLDDTDRRPAPLLLAPGVPIVVLAPHMDDEAAGCGGAIRMHARTGSPVTVVYLTDGRRGNPRVYQGHPSAGEIRRGEQDHIDIRKREARRASEILGVTDLVFLDAPDGALEPTEAVVNGVLRVLEQRRPHVIYVPSLMDLHGDHWSANRVLQAVLQRWDEDSRQRAVVRGYEVWTPVLANRILDIGDAAEDKRRALEQFESQNTHIDYTRVMMGLGVYRSIYFQRGQGHAEAFFECPATVYLSLFERLTKRS